VRTGTLVLSLSGLALMGLGAGVGSKLRERSERLVRLEMARLCSNRTGDTEVPPELLESSDALSRDAEFLGLVNPEYAQEAAAKWYEGCVYAMTISKPMTKSWSRSAECHCRNTKVGGGLRLFGLRLGGRKSRTDYKTLYFHRDQNAPGKAAFELGSITRCLHCQHFKGWPQDR